MVCPADCSAARTRHCRACGRQVTYVARRCRVMPERPTTPIRHPTRCAIGDGSGVCRHGSYRLPWPPLVPSGLQHVSDQLDYGNLHAVQQPDSLLRLVKPTKKDVRDCSPDLPPLYLDGGMLRYARRQEPPGYIILHTLNVPVHGLLMCAPALPIITKILLYCSRVYSKSAITLFVSVFSCNCMSSVSRLGAHMILVLPLTWLV